MLAAMSAASDEGRIGDLRRRASALLQARQLGAAAEACRQLRVLSPQLADAHFLSGAVAAEQQQPSAAAEHLRRAVELAPDHVDAWAQLARVRSLLRDRPASLAAADRALALQPARALTLDTLGVVYSRANRHDRAAEAFRRAVALSPGTASFQFNLASALKFLGDFEGSEAAYEACLQADPRCWKAYPPLSQLRRQTTDRNHLSRYRAALATADGTEARLQLHMAIAKELEDLGEAREALAHLQAGKSARRAELGYRSEDDAALFAALIAHFETRAPATPGFASAEPIFVIGLPRSGTTLVERILSSHSQVHSAGELQNFGMALKRASGSRSARLLDAETITGLSQWNPAAIGEAYVASTRPDSGQTPHFIDKMPLNFLYAGFIAQALPNARIVCLRRHPLDVCLANFRQLFALNFSYYNYSYDLLDTGRYYLEFERLMRFWAERFPGRILDVQYESLVADPELQIRRLVAGCGLPWEEACLHFERNEAPVSTASAVQVRQPIYRSSVQRWKQLEAELRPLRELLEAGGVTIPE